MNLRTAGLLLALLSSGCAAGPTLAPGTVEGGGRSIGSSVPAAIQTAAAPFAPVVDHHKHLMGPGIFELRSMLPLPRVEVPEDLAQLLSERAKRWNDRSAIAELYTEDAVLHDSRVPAWYRGRDEIGGFVIGRFRDGYHVTPVAFDLGESRGYLAGYLTRYEGGDTTHFMYVHQSLEKGADGKWRIAAETFTYTGPPPGSLTVDVIVKELEMAGIRRGVVLSTAYMFGSHFYAPVENEYAKVRAENDWVAQEVARFPDRLVAFCGVNPLKDYAIEEVERCGNHPGVTGMKFHFANSGVDVLDPDHVEKLRRVFRAANDHRLPIVAHVWTPGRYGREHAEAFLNQILPEAPDVTVQIPHMAGGGRSTDPALAVYADAIASGDPRTRNLYFDVATLVQISSPETVLEKDAMRMRQIGLERILWGSDMTAEDNLSGQQWRVFRGLMPLTQEELRTLAGNVAPYLR